MIKLNLLPPEEKEIISSRNTLKKIITAGSYGLFFILIFLLLLFSVWLFIIIELRAQESIFQLIEKSPENQVFSNFKKEVNQINKRLQELEKIQQDSKNYSLAIQKLTEIIPPGVKLNNLFIEGKGAILKGYASTREQLVSFKDSLDKSNYFTDIENPLGNLLKQKDIIFSIGFKIK